jgi:hypothetical protein
LLLAIGAIFHFRRFLDRSVTRTEKRRRGEDSARLDVELLGHNDADRKLADRKFSAAAGRRETRAAQRR